MKIISEIQLSNDTVDCVTVSRIWEGLSQGLAGRDDLQKLDMRIAVTDDWDAVEHMEGVADTDDYYSLVIFVGNAEDMKESGFSMNYLLKAVNPL